jgi:hypothetical protein
MTPDVRILMDWLLGQDDTHTVLRAVMTGLSRIIEVDNVKTPLVLQEMMDRVHRMLCCLWSPSLTSDDKMFADSLRTVGLLLMVKKKIRHVSDEAEYPYNSLSRQKVFDGMQSSKTQVVLASLSSIRILDADDTHPQIRIMLEPILERSVSSLESQMRWDFESAAVVCGNLNVLATTVRISRDLSIPLLDSFMQRVSSICATVNQRRISRYNMSIVKQVNILREFLNY